MKNTHNILFLLVLIMISSFQNPEKKSFDYGAYLNASKALWERHVQQVQNEYNANKTNDNRFDLALAQYGILSWTLKDQDEQVFDQYLDDTLEHLDFLIEMNYRKADCQALLSAIYGFRVAYAPWKGMFFGPKGAGLIEEAMKLNPESPIVQKLYGNNNYFTPEMWGGDISLAVDSYEKAVTLFENKGDTVQNWLYLDTYAWLGKAYQRTGDNEKAEEIYNRALVLEENFNWVKYALLPELNGK